MDFNSLPTSGSTIAEEIDPLYNFLVWLCAFLLVGIMATMFWFIIRYRRKDDELPQNPVTHNIPLEVTWALIPTLVLLFVFAWGFRTWLMMRVVPGEAMDVRATARQWAWSFEYPNDGILSEDLVVPVDTTIKVTMTSADVIHSFFVPEFRVKQDVLPERYTIAWFKATKTGTYNLLCAEYCGKDHSRMNRAVKVLSKSDYQEWVDSGGGMRGLSMSDRGKLLFTRFGCNQCHSVDGSKNTGPTLAGLYGRQELMGNGEKVLADDNYLKSSILYPMKHIVAGYAPRMPSYKGSMREAQLQAIIEYIKSLASPEITK